MLLKRLVTVALVICAVMFLSAAAALSIDMNEGDWQVTMTTSMQGVPFQMAPQTYTMTQCVTKDDMAPHNKNKKDCVIKDQKIAGNTYYWKVVCEDASGRTEGDGQITYSGATYSGTINTKMTDNRHGGSEMTMITKLKGRYLGPCSAATRAEAEQRKAQSK
jgi:hypothetical protein